MAVSLWRGCPSGQYGIILLWEAAPRVSSLCDIAVCDLMSGQISKKRIWIISFRILPWRGKSQANKPTNQAFHPGEAESAPFFPIKTFFDLQTGAFEKTVVLFHKAVYDSCNLRGAYFLGKRSLTNLRSDLISCFKFLIFDSGYRCSPVSDLGRNLRKRTMFFDVVILLGFVAVGAVFALIVEFLNAV